MELRSSSFLILVVVCFQNMILPGSCFYDMCNRTWTKLATDTVLNFDLPTVPSPMVSQHYYCWFKFAVSPDQRLEVTVTKIHAGYYDVNSRSCQLGRLIINEGLGTNPVRWPLPTFICGAHEDLDAMRVTLGNTSLVEFKVESLQLTNGFTAQVRVIKTANRTREQTFGSTLDGPGKHPGTNCDWIVPVNECKRRCKVYSPGWPGIYPPNTRCRYLLTNAKRKRIELDFWKFDIRESDNCMDDRLSVYDGPDIKSKLIGRFCGRAAPRVISKGSAILLVFETGPGAPQWDYDGFNIMVAERWSDDHPGGHRQENSLCNWSFSSKNLDKGRGDAHVPDYQLPPNATCDYKFMVNSDENLKLTLIFYTLLDKCDEYIQVFDGEKIIDTICEERLGRRRLEILYNATCSVMTVRYVNKVGQTSNEEQPWIYYEYTSKSPENKIEDLSRKNTPKGTTDGTSVGPMEPGEMEGKAPEVRSHGAFVCCAIISTLLYNWSTY